MFDMHNCSSKNVPVAKGDKLSKDQCSKNEGDKKKIVNGPYPSTIDTLMYA